MNAAATLGRGLEQAGVIVAALLAAGAVLAPSVRARALAMAGALCLTPVLLVAEIWDTPSSGRCASARRSLSPLPSPGSHWWPVGRC